MSDRPVLRDSRGRFVKGTAPGPGRPPKKPIDFYGTQLWDLRTLRDAWRMMKTINWWNTKGPGIRCRFCGNNEPEEFLYGFDRKRRRIRYRCKRCGYWSDIKEKHTWYAPPLPYPLSRSDAALVAQQRGYPGKKDGFE